MAGDGVDQRALQYEQTLVSSLYLQRLHVTRAVGRPAAARSDVTYGTCGN